MESRRTIVLGAGAALTAAVAPRARSANGRIRLAVLGVNGRGTAHIGAIQSQPDAEVAMLCDPDAQVLAKRASEFEQKYNRKVATEQDLRKVFDNKDIDAVTVATPNHWHALATIWACQAGKDVYVEKPGAHNVFEGRKMVEAAHKYRRIVQHGVQLRSSPAIQEAVEHLRKGTIGKVYMSRGLVFRWRPSIGHKATEPTPSYLNWDLWQGPAQTREFTRRLVHYNWHWTWEYGNGDVGNQGIHETDLCLWGLGLETLPSQITSLGGKFLFDDDKETPETQTSLYRFGKEDKIIQFEVRPWCTNDEGGASVGNIFYGSEGYLVVKGYSSYEIFLGRERTPGPQRKEGEPMKAHMANFLQAMRSRKTSDQNGPVETAHRASALAHLGNIAFRTGRVLTFDPVVEKFVGDAQANAMLTRKYRAPYIVPEKV
jgi:predicted dehydrogenase